MNMKLLQAKSNWITYMCEHYFEEKDKNFLPEKNEREEFFLANIQRGLKLNEKDFIEYLDNEGWMANTIMPDLIAKDGWHEQS
jgi:hypothetical protein